jgi:hypothetical protein
MWTKVIAIVIRQSNVIPSGRAVNTALKAWRLKLTVSDGLALRLSEGKPILKNLLTRLEILEFWSRLRTIRV